MKTEDSNIYNKMKEFTLKDYEFMWKYDNKPSKITENIYLGNKEASSNYNFLKENKITHILVCGSDLEIHYADFFKYKIVNILDHDNEDIKKYFNDCYEFIEEAVKNDKKILIHCSAGISRSATITCAYLMKKQNINMNEALKIIWEGRIIAEPNRGFKKQLNEYYDSDIKK